MTSFRPITHVEIPQAVVLMSEFYAIDGYPMDAAHSARLFGVFLERPELGHSWFVIEDDAMVGYIILTFIFSFEYGGTIAFIDELYIKESFRGRGLGKAAIAFVKEQAAGLGLCLLYLEVEHHNSNAQRLYQNAGFTTHKRTLMRYQPD